ncbi:hypothetical protein F5Y08DRAFT_291809 [Xylaria arbuscula]|nr:hypothetical protein F5Y08DRAFT_291809 [Xylaria arbuscula]
MSAGLVVGSVTTSESPVLYVFFLSIWTLAISTSAQSWQPPSIPILLPLLSGRWLMYLGRYLHLFHDY